MPFATMVRAGCTWRLLPNDLPPWYTVHQQTMRWVKAQAAEQGIRLEVIKLSDAKRGFVLLPRRWVVERTFG